MFDFWIQFALVLTAILIGIRRGGVALGLIGGLGVAVLTFGFRVAPSEPPITVMSVSVLMGRTGEVVRGRWWPSSNCPNGTSRFRRISSSSRRVRGRRQETGRSSSVRRVVGLRTW